MKRMMPRLAVTATCAAGLGGFVAAPAQAATAISYPKVLNVTTTSAVVRATINTGGVPYNYTFVYGTDTNYDLGGTEAVFVPAGSGTVTISEPITDLTPGTRYHFQLDLQLNPQKAYYQVQPVFGPDATFKTLPAGKLVLTSSKIPVKHGKALIALKCASADACKGKLTVTVRHKGKTVTCVSSKLSIRAGKKATLKSGVSRGCLALIAAAKNVQLKANFGATFDSVQPTIRNKKVTLVLVK